MRDAVNTEVHRVIQRMFFEPMGPTAINQFLDIHVSRDNIVTDTIRELSEHSTSDLKKPLRVRDLMEIRISLYTQNLITYYPFI